MIIISQLETIETSQKWIRSGVRVNIGSSVVVFEEECDAVDAVKAIEAVDDMIEILEAAKRWRKAMSKKSSAGAIDEYNAALSELIVLIDKVRE